MPILPDWVVSQGLFGGAFDDRFGASGAQTSFPDRYDPITANRLPTPAEREQFIGYVQGYDPMMVGGPALTGNSGAPIPSYAPQASRPAMPPQMANLPSRPMATAAQAPQSAAPMGALGRLGQGINDNSMMLAAMGMGLMGGEGFGGAARLGLVGSQMDRKNRSETQQQAAIRAALTGKFPPAQVEAAANNPDIAKLLLARLYPDKQFGFMQLPDGTVVRNDPHSGSAVPVLAGEKAPETKEFEGPDGSKSPYQWSPAAKAWVPAAGVAASEPSNPYALAKGTEGQQNSALFANRLHASERILRDVKSVDAATSIPQRLLQDGSKLYNLNSEQFQKYEQAKRDFINATLRRESGAVISPAEFENAELQYFPMPGNTPDVIEQKKRNREEAIKGIAGGAGRHYKPPYAFDQRGNIVGDTAPTKRIKIDASGKRI